MTKGFTLYIYKNPSFAVCSNGGISEKHDEVLWIGGDVAPPAMTERQELPRVLLVKGNLPGTIKAIPCDDAGNPKGGSMMGGAYIASSDSRFSAACDKITGGRFYGAVALHDRFE